MRDGEEIGRGAHDGDRGSSYVAILALVLVMTLLSLTFIGRVSLHQSESGMRTDAIQADYLARAAAGHALFKLKSDGTFPADEDTYFMHDYRGGRYGYMVRRHTASTFATIATIGVKNGAVAEHSYVLYFQ